MKLWPASYSARKGQTFHAQRSLGRKSTGNNISKPKKTNMRRKSVKEKVM